MNENQTIPIRKPNGQGQIVPEGRPQSDASKKDIPKYPPTQIPLSTQGWFYSEGHPLSCGYIELNQMTAAEEDLLADINLFQKGILLNKLIERLVTNKAIQSDDILIQDNDAIFIGIRRLAYGDSYDFSIQCPQCNAENTINVNLGELQNKPFEFEKYEKGKNEFSFSLPSGNVLTYKFLTDKESKSIDSELAALKRQFKGGISKELTTRLFYMIKSVNGNYDRPTIKKFVDKEFLSSDSLAFRKHIKENSPGIDTSFLFKCNSCNCEKKVGLPFGASFLFPDIET